MKTSRMQKLTVGFIGLLALTLFIRDVRSPDYMEGWDLATFASLPVQEGGRIKPVDTVARTTLMLLGGKQTYRDVDGTRHEAVEWLAELLLNPQAAASRPVFRIDHPELVGLLGYQNEERKYFALAEIAPHFNQLQAEFEGVPQESRLRNAYEAALAKLQNSLALYDRVAYALVPPPFFGDALSTYGMVLRAHADAIAAEPGTETHGTVGNALRLFKSQFSQLAAGTSIQAIPPLSPEDTNGWHTLGSSLLQTADTGQLDPVVNGYAELSLAFAQRDALQFNEPLPGSMKRLPSGRAAATTNPALSCFSIPLPPSTTRWSCMCSSSLWPPFPGSDGHASLPAPPSSFLSWLFAYIPLASVPGSISRPDPR
jgi:hypothetical protein